MKRIALFLSLTIAWITLALPAAAQEKVIGDDPGYRTHAPDEHAATGDGHEYPIEEPTRWGRTESWELGLGLLFLGLVLAGGLAIRGAKSRRDD